MDILIFEKIEHLLEDYILNVKWKKGAAVWIKQSKRSWKKIEEEILLKRKNPLFDIGKNGNVSFSLNGENNWVRKIDIQEYGTL